MGFGQGWLVSKDLKILFSPLHSPESEQLETQQSLELSLEALDSYNDSSKSLYQILLSICKYDSKPSGN
jgi:hypothetical protein